MVLSMLGLVSWCAAVSSSSSLPSPAAVLTPLSRDAVTILECTSLNNGVMKLESINNLECWKVIFKIVKNKVFEHTTVRGLY